MEIFRNPGAKTLLGVDLKEKGNYGVAVVEQLPPVQLAPEPSGDPFGADPGDRLRGAADCVRPATA
jgi:hypothetical protein